MTLFLAAHSIFFSAYLLPLYMGRICIAEMADAIGQLPVDVESMSIATLAGDGGLSMYFFRAEMPTTQARSKRQRPLPYHILTPSWPLTSCNYYGFSTVAFTPTMQRRHRGASASDDDFLS